jgi:hypothetical protein
MLGVIEQRDAVENVKVELIRYLYFPWRCLEILTGLNSGVQETLTILNGLQE